MSDSININRRNRRSNQGQALVELALMLPLVLLLLLGSIDFGHLFMNKLILTNAAREGASYISYRFDSEDLATSQAETRAVVIAEGDSSGIIITSGQITFAGCCTSGQPVSVTVTQQVDLIFDAFLQAIGIIDGPVVLSSTVTMMGQ